MCLYKYRVSAQSEQPFVTFGDFLSSQFGAKTANLFITYCKNSVSDFKKSAVIVCKNYTIYIRDPKRLHFPSILVANHLGR